MNVKRTLYLQATTAGLSAKFFGYDFNARHTKSLSTPGRVSLYTLLARQMLTEEIKKLSRCKNCVPNFIPLQMVQVWVAYFVLKFDFSLKTPSK